MIVQSKISSCSETSQSGRDCGNGASSRAWSFEGGFGLYNVVAIMAYLLDGINPGTTWPQHLIALVDQFPTNEHIDISSMGFPQGWIELDLWSAGA